MSLIKLPTRILMDNRVATRPVAARSFGDLLDGCSVDGCHFEIVDLLGAAMGVDDGGNAVMASLPSEYLLLARAVAEVIDNCEMVAQMDCKEIDDGNTQD